MGGTMFPDRTITAVLWLLIPAVLILQACGGNGGGGDRLAPEAAPPVVSEWLISTDFVVDGGPGKDGIPALTDPEFESVQTIRTVNVNDLAIAVKRGDSVKIYPHDIMDYHEIVNEIAEESPFALSYCPLTGSATAWTANVEHADSSFGVSGLLYNSNLLLYDRETDTLWSQIYEQAVSGPRIREVPERLQALEAKFGTLKAMFPDAMVMTRNTGYRNDYVTYPYGNYRESAGLLYPVTNSDNRMHPKTRVLGVRTSIGVDETAPTKVYQIGAFGATTQAINDQVGETSIVVVGNTELDFAVAFDRRLPDGTILTFTAVDGALPVVMQDDEGTAWDAFGTAVDGPRAGQQLAMTDSFIAFWFAWVAHFPEAGIHFNVSAP